MSDITVIGRVSEQETMTSLELARVTGSRHDHLKRGIVRQAARGGFLLPPLEGVANPSSGPAKIGIYRLDKNQSISVVAKLCPEFLQRIIDRWQRLEDERAAENSRDVAVPDFSDPAEMAEAWAAQYRAAQAAEREVLQLESKAVRDAPMVAFAEAVQESDDAIDIATMAKLIGIGPLKLFDFLRDEKRVIFRDYDGYQVPHQRHIDNGRMRVVESAYQVRGGRTLLSRKTVITGKGQLYVTKLWLDAHSGSLQMPLPC